MKLSLLGVYSDRFSYDKTEHTFTTELSDLGGFRIFQRFYTDSMDVGFVMINKKNGRRAEFSLESEFLKDEEITHWLFTPTPDSVKLYPLLRNCKVYIFND